MSGWASLSGYLLLKPGGGGLNILKSRKKLWCILEESQGKLLYFKTEEDARSKPPLGFVELKGAAITLDMDTQNQFVIIVEGREILLTAENHESMMIWMMALQARRDQFALADKAVKEDLPDFDFDPFYVTEDRQSSNWSRDRVCFDLYTSDSTDSMVAVTERDPVVIDIYSSDTTDSINKEFAKLAEIRSASDLSVLKSYKSRLGGQDQQYDANHKPLESAKSLHLHQQSLTPVQKHSRTSPDWKRGQLQRIGGTIDGHASLKSAFEKDRSRSLPPLLEDSALNVLQPESKQHSVSMEMTEVLQMVEHQQSFRGNVQPPKSPLVNGGLHLWSSGSQSADNSDDHGLDIAKHRALSRSASDRQGNDVTNHMNSLYICDSPLNSSDSKPGERVNVLEQELMLEF